MKKIRKLLVLLGYEPWRRCSQVAAWNQSNGRAAVMYCTRDGYKDLYIEHGLKCEPALKFEAERIMELKEEGDEYIILERTKIPIGRVDRDNWTVNFNRKRIEVK